MLISFNLSRPILYTVRLTGHPSARVIHEQSTETKAHSKYVLIPKSSKMFQNLVVTGLTPLCSTNEIQNWDNRPFNGKWPENQRTSNRGSNLKKPIRKKPKRVRTAYSTNQLQALEKIYSTSKYIDVKRRKQLAETLNIGDKALKIWFQNRRMKEKKETSESSCDTSSEILSCRSPANDCVEPKCEVNIPYPDFSECYQPDQYQFPTFYYNEGVTGHYQNWYPYEHNGTSFGVDTSVYPTQYYPTDCQYNNIDAYGSYNQVQNAYEMDSWYAKSFNFTT